MTLLRVVPLAILASAVGLRPAHADIYTWVDASGRVNVSNLDPPEGVNVTNVTHESAPKAPARPDLASDAPRPAEIQALSERVRQLEGELAFAQNQMPPPAPYPPMAAPPVVQYFVDVTAPPIDYYSGGASGCDPTWANCATWWNAGAYPVGVVFLPRSGFRRFPPAHGGHSPGWQPPARGPGGIRRG